MNNNELFYIIAIGNNPSDNKEWSRNSFEGAVALAAAAVAVFGFNKAVVTEMSDKSVALHVVNKEDCEDDCCPLSQNL